LDVTIQAEILALIDRLKRETGTAVMFITHDMAVVAQMADRVVVMFRGNKVEEGPVEEIFERPQHDYTKRCAGGGAQAGRDALARPIPNRCGFWVLRGPHRSPIGSEVPAFAAGRGADHAVCGQRGLFRRTVANVHAVEDVSFTLNKGRTLSLVGESGCGKSTAGRSILRLVEPQSGEVSLDGVDVMALGRRSAQGPRRYADDVSRPVCQPEPADAVDRSSGRTHANYGTTKVAEFTTVSRAV
jgi:ABC-type glutathione transport system ATPase component